MMVSNAIEPQMSALHSAIDNSLSPRDDVSQTSGVHHELAAAGGHFEIAVDDRARPPCRRTHRSAGAPGGWQPFRRPPGQGPIASHLGRSRVEPGWSWRSYFS